jgi:hypothetical protein
MNAPFLRQVRTPRLRVGLIVAALATFAPAAAPRSAGAEGRAAAQQGDSKTHKHVWVKQSRKVWVPPVTKVVQVGVDAKGKPIFETQVVKPGYWRTETWHSCSCGATKG